MSAGFFRTLGVTPMLGRDFRDGEDLAGGYGNALIGHLPGDIGHVREATDFVGARPRVCPYPIAYGICAKPIHRQATFPNCLRLDVGSARAKQPADVQIVT